MIEKVVKRLRREEDTPQRDLEYWLSRSPEERLAAVELLRRQYHGRLPRLRRVARVLQRASR